MGRWSLRAKLVALVAVALLPLLALAAWVTNEGIQATRGRRAEGVASVLERVLAGHRDLIDGSRRMLMAACTEASVRGSADPAPPSDEVAHCETYLGALLQDLPAKYSAALVTDEDGIVRCSSVPTALGTSLVDRDLFRQVRQQRDFAVGTYIASRVTPYTVVPIAMPILSKGRFAGMCALGIRLESFTALGEAAGGSDAIPVQLVDLAGMPVGGSATKILELPVPARLAAAIAGSQAIISDYGQNGSFEEFHIVRLPGSSLFAVAAVPTAQGVPAAWQAYGWFVLLAVAAAIVLVATWLGADRWCVRPLRYIGDYAGRVARGEVVNFTPSSPWTRELAGVGDGVRQMAEAIASRESELRAGLEQRDHMLREIHHRVKNNLQMISSLLNLQAGEIRSPRLRRFFGDAQNRVLTLSILHRHLYERSSWALVDFQQFISDLVRQISVGRSTAGRPAPRYHIRAPIMAVGPDTAIPVGLIVTEAVGGALSHDFAAIDSPEIRIEANDKGGEQVELVIEDNGRRSQYAAIGPDTRGSFGLTLIRGLAMQLGGDVQILDREGGGTRVVVTFPMARESDVNV